MKTLLATALAAQADDALPPPDDSPSGVTAEQIGAALGLTNVTLYVNAGRASITAAEPVTPAMQAAVQRWFEAGAVNAASAQWDLFLDGTITDSVTGISLKANRQARNDFIGQATLLREAVDAGVIEPTAMQSIWDASEVEHTLTVAEMRALLLRYGIAWQAAFNALAP